MSHELKTGGDRGYLRIATEEAFATQEQIDLILKMVKEGRADRGTTSLWTFYGASNDERAQLTTKRLLDLGETRIADMDATGIDIAVLSLTSPGVQAYDDVDTAKRVCVDANDILADACKAYPTRYVGMTSIAPQDPEWSAQEIRRGADLGFRGVMVNSHTHGEYLDNPKFDPIFRALADTGQPLYIHPSPPPDSMIGPMLEAGLDGAVYGFGVDTGLHGLRVITSGIFDRYPDLQMILGHGGEALPYWLFRTNFMHQAGVRSKRYECLKPLKHDLFHYMRNNVIATTSGLAWEPAITMAMNVMGDDRVMYAMDYPYQYIPDEVRTYDNFNISDEAKKKLMQTNAERIFKL
ncbi:MAG: amidohydrolase [Sphingobium sp.]|nr:amidohydrolase [Sphingobium sp.]